MGVGACRSVLDSKRTEEYALDGIEAFRGRPIEEDYELVKSIGEGMYGRVHMARARVTAMLWAIKTQPRVTRFKAGGVLESAPGNVSGSPGALHMSCRTLPTAVAVPAPAGAAATAIALPLHAISCIMSSPPASAWQVVELVCELAWDFRHVGITLGESLVNEVDMYTKASIPSAVPVSTVGTSDTTWLADPERYAIVVTAFGAAVLCVSKRLKLVMGSSSEAEGRR